MVKDSMIIDVLFLCLLSCAISTPTCSTDSSAGDICALHVKDVLPTQFAVGMMEIECKVGRFESMSSSDLDKYLKKFVSNNGFYITDHHHLARALYDADIDKDEKWIYLNVTHNWSRYTAEVFWEYMVNQQQVWLYDQKGLQAMTPWYLPVDLEHMIDDPFRSLAWMVRNNGGYGHVDTDYADFMWANFLRNNIHLNSTNAAKPSDPNSWTWCAVSPYSPKCISDLDTQLKAVLPYALKLAASPAASHLPGYGQGTVDPPNCGKK